MSVIKKAVGLARKQPRPVEDDGSVKVSKELRIQDRPA